jgi:DNA (cytosine-5)-methyltransferase 1
MERKMQKFKGAKVIDLFCGIGGMTHGFILEGFDVVAGIDIDESCKYGYEKSNKCRFINKNISDLRADDLNELYGKEKCIRILIGCAPCQPFSGLNPLRKGIHDPNTLLKFAELIESIKPDIVSMENVRGLANESKFPVFGKFIKLLNDNGYHIHKEIVNCWEYGVPQTRRRLVVLASKLGPIILIDKTHTKENRITVRDIISDLPHIVDGENNANDPLHRASKLDDINKRRMMATPPNGGDSRNWDEELQLKCHKKKTGRTYKHSVYARMKWEEPGPTMTTLCVGIGNGRFGHPEQHRAISLREAARFQTFPDNYIFYNPNQKINYGKIAQYIGNAVPVTLARVIAKSIKEHVSVYARTT